MHTVERSLLALCPAARSLTVTFVFEDAWTRGCVELRRVVAAAGGTCREIRLSGPLFILYTPLKRVHERSTAWL